MPPNVDNVRNRIESATSARAIVAPIGKPLAIPLEELERIYGEALAAMCDDLNTSVAIAKALEGAKVILRDTDLSEATAID